MVEFLINIKPCEKQGIYSITNNIDDRIYIGRTKNFYERAYKHRENYLKGLGNSKVRAFIKEHPDARFEFKVILETDDIKAKEEEYITKYKTVEHGFNIVHNDDEIKEIFIKNRKAHKFFPKKPKKHYFVSEFEYLGLKKGYIREKGVLLYRPQKAKQILKNYTIKEEEKEIIKAKPKIKKSLKRRNNPKNMIGIQ